MKLQYKVLLAIAGMALLIGLAMRRRRKEHYEVPAPIPGNSKLAIFRGLNFGNPAIVADDKQRQEMQKQEEQRVVDDHAYGYWTMNPYVAVIFASHPKNEILIDPTISSLLWKHEESRVDDLAAFATDYISHWLKDRAERESKYLSDYAWGLILRAEIDSDTKVRHDLGNEHMLEMEIFVEQGNVNITHIGLIDNETFPPLWVRWDKLPSNTAGAIRDYIMEHGKERVWGAERVPLAIQWAISEGDSNDPDLNAYRTVVNSDVWTLANKVFPEYDKHEKWAKRRAKRDAKIKSEQYGSLSPRGVSIMAMIKHGDDIGRLSNYNQEMKDYWLGKGTRFYVPDSNGRIKIFRATVGDEIRIGDYVSNSLDYVNLHKESNMPAETKPIKVLAKEVGLDELMPADGPNEFWLIPSINVVYATDDGKAQLGIAYDELDQLIIANNPFLSSVWEQSNRRPLSQKQIEVFKRIYDKERSKTTLDKFKERLSSKQKRAEKEKVLEQEHYIIEKFGPQIHTSKNWTTPYSEGQEKNRYFISHYRNAYWYYWDTESVSKTRYATLESAKRGIKNWRDKADDISPLRISHFKDGIYAPVEFFIATDDEIMEYWKDKTTVVRDSATQENLDDSKLARVYMNEPSGKLIYTGPPT